MNLSARQCVYLQSMDIDIWRDRNSNDVLSDSFNQTGSSTVTRADSHFDWAQLQNSVAHCTLCELHESRTQTVFGVGDEHADWMIIGEAPGAEEDKQGEPFVGRAGKLLNNMLIAVGLSREKVFIANILKCRPPNNRDPKTEEVIQCENYLKQQIELVQPKIILTLGRVAAQNLLKVDTPIGRMRGNEYFYSEKNIPVIVTYHPAYLLRSPKEKQKSWNDLLTAKKLYEQMI